MEAILDEARLMQDMGVRELILIAHTSRINEAKFKKKSC